MRLAWVQQGAPRKANLQVFKDSLQGIFLHHPFSDLNPADILMSEQLKSASDRGTLVEAIEAFPN